MNITRVSTLVAAGSLCAMSAPLTAGGETITVTTLNDVVDFVSPQFVTSLPGPDGIVSFREACLAANNTAGPQTIEFAIPQSEFWLDASMAFLRLENGIFPLDDHATTVDFTTQTEFTGDTNPNGWEVGIYGLEPNAWGVAAIYVNGDNCVIKGLGRVLQRGYGVRIVGNNNRVISSTISGPLYAGVIVQGWPGDPAMNNTVGGTLAEERNILAAGNCGVRIDGPADGTVVIGNTLVGSSFAGVEVRGASCCPDYTPFNTRIGGPTPEEANWIADNGKFGEEGFPLGNQVQVEWAVSTIVEGNIIGTTQDGTARFPNAHGTVGVGVRESDDTIVRNNLIAGIRKEGVNHHAGEVFGTAVYVNGPNTGVVVEGNRIGTDITGENPVPNLHGINFAWFQGYPTDGLVLDNTVAFNEAQSVGVATGVTGVTISANSIHSNALLGIDLGLNGVTPNDAGDADTGANGLQNFPVITSAAATASTITIDATLNSRPSRTYIIELFANQQCDASGHGEGRAFLGSVTETTDAAGNLAFSATLPFTPDSLTVVTGTATDTVTGETSEFSACADIEQDESMSGDVNADGKLTAEDRAMFCAAIGSSVGELEYMEGADLNADGTIDQVDLDLLNDIMPVCNGDVVSSATFQPPADGIVDGADLAYLLGAWGAQPSCADFVNSKTFQPPPDGKVDGADLAYMLGAWGACQ